MTGWEVVTALCHEICWPTASLLLALAILALIDAWHKR